MILWSRDPGYNSSWVSSCPWNSVILVYQAPEVLWSYESIILGMLKHLGFELPLDVVGLVAELVLKPEGTVPLDKMGFLCLWIPWVSHLLLRFVLGLMLWPPHLRSSGMLELPRVQLLLCVAGLDVELKPRSTQGTIIPEVQICPSQAKHFRTKFQYKLETMNYYST